MADEIQRLNDVLAVLQERLGGATGLSVDELLVVDAPPGATAPLGSLTIQIAQEPFALLGVTIPESSSQAGGLVAYMARRARARRASFLALSNQSDILLVKTPRRDGEALEILHHYPVQPLTANDARAALTPVQRNALIQTADRLGADLLRLKRDGRLDLVLPDAEFFVNRLTRAVEALKPSVKQALQTKLGMDVQFAQEIEAWATPQGIPADLRSSEFGEAVVRQAIYRLLGKIIFYQSLRRAMPSLPPTDVAGLDTAQVLPALAHCFAEAHKIDYHAVFREDVVDRLPFPAAASAELRALVEDLNTRDFAHLPQDVVSAVFERLIPPEDRHALGQYFTMETLADLIIGFCVRRADDAVMDATCGTGTFLIRAYDRKRTAFGLHDHSQQLGLLWGIDLAPFPAELATINLFRQQISQPGNFPRILNEDFFNVVPGGRYRFPPLKPPTGPQPGQDSGAGEIDEPIPAFDAIVGNFPYINAARIEQREKGYLQRVNRRLAEEWLRPYPTGFTFAAKADEKQHRLAVEQGLDVTPFVGKAQPIITAFADLYVSLFWHTAAFLKPNGRMGIVTSNAWLDVGYGYALQRFFLDHFKIIAILESRCEPWFEQAAVNTVVTIVERCASPTQRDAHPARFVKIKRPLAELIPQDMRLDAINRWLGVQKLVQRIEAVGEEQDLQGLGDSDGLTTHEDDDFRIRCVSQEVLRRQAEASGQTVKWGPYLRAPQVYFDLLAAAGDKLALLRDIAPPTFGSKTGINEFFHFNPAKIEQWNIEPEFLFPVLKSPGDSDRILIDEAGLRLKVFVCRLTKDELRAQGKLNALRYIEWGEHQVFVSGAQAGLTWPHGAEVRARKPGWYALPEYRSRFAQLFFASAYGERHIHKYSPTPLIADKRLYFLSPIEGLSQELTAAVLNSSVTTLFTELAGRVSLGDGALELTVEDASDSLRVPDIRQLTETSQKNIETAFQSLLTRSIGSVFDEVQKPDRQGLDQAVLRAMDLDPARWLPRIYHGLTTLVRERTQMGQKRGQARKSRPLKAANRVAEEVWQDLLPDGPRRFPDAFLSPAARAEPLRDIPLPEGTLRYRGHLLGQEELATDDGQTLHVANKFEVRYVLYAQASDQTVARLPRKPVEVSRAVNTYAQYLRQLRQSLHQTYYVRTLDRTAAERFVAETWRKFNLPDVEG
ncbi:MAG: N-6 DNA methylase [Anaerolinea sp.]|nr:N-6 DNA methylase [Anaerolinea sp.]